MREEDTLARAVRRDLELIREKIISHRVDLGLGQEDMAKLCGLSKTMYGDLERGKRSLSVEHVLRIHHTARLDLNLLFSL